MKRAIRLKEFEPNSRIVNTPPDWYIAARDPSLPQKEYEIVTDENGFIVPAQRRPGRKIIVLGDSVVEGMFLDPDRRFCSVLNDVLGRSFGDAVEVLNGGYSGATVLHILNVFINKVIPLVPLAVVIMTGIVDVDAAKKQLSFWNNDCWLEPLFDIHNNNSARDERNNDECDFADRNRLMNVLLSAACSFNIPIWFATLPHRQIYAGDYVQRAYPIRSTFDEELFLRRRMNAETRRFALLNRCPLFDFEIDLLGEDHIFYDMFHMNASGGHTVVSSMLRSGVIELIERQLV